MNATIDEDSKNVNTTGLGPLAIEEGLDKPVEISSMRLNILLWICMFLSAIETTIVATSLIEITNYFGEYNSAAWIVAAYLLTYNGFLLISSKMGDIFGFKMVLVAANLFFMLSSILCGVSQSMNQLIIFRSFQGIGGSGIYGVVFIVLSTIVPVKRMPPYAAGVSSVFAVASICGPLLGGTISQHSTWRWIFYLNGPGISVSIMIIFFAMPKSTVKLDMRKAIKRIDFVGGLLSIGWSILLVFALQEGGVEFSWNSGTVISTLVAGAVTFFLFIVYELSVEQHKTKEPIFPIELLRNGVTSLLLLMTFTMGFSFYIAVINLPQRFQIVNGASPTHAGILMLPMLLAGPVASGLVGGVVSKYMHWGLPLVPIGALFTLLGTVLIGQLPSDSHIQARQYGFLVILGLGMGILMPISMMLARLEVEDKHLSTAIGATNMLRVLGGLVGISMCTAVLHGQLKSKLPGILTDSQLSSLLQSTQILETLDFETLTKVRLVYSDAYNLQFRIISAFASITVIAAFGIAVVIRRRGPVKDYIQKSMVGK